MTSLIVAGLLVSDVIVSGGVSDVISSSGVSNGIVARLVTS